jgi:hypothetical protein
MKKLLLLLLLSFPATAQTIPFTSSSMMYMKPAAAVQSSNSIMNKVVNYTCTTNYYVNASTGNDGNTATQAQSPSTPWQTIQHATSGAAVFTAGACINVAAGNYTGTVSLQRSGGGAGNANATNGYAVLRCSTPASPFTGIRPSCILSVNVTSGPGVFMGYSYAGIDGFEITNNNTNDVNGINSNASSIHHLFVYNSYVHGFGGGGIGFNQGEYYYVQGNEVSGNACCSTFDDSGISFFEQTSTGSESGTLDLALGSFTTPAGTVHIHDVVSNNISYNNVENNVHGNNTDTDGEGIIMDCNHLPTSCGGGTNYPYGMLLYGNIVYGNGGKGIEVGRSNNVWVVNNTSYGNNTDIHACAVTAGACTNTGGTGGDYGQAELWGTCSQQYTFQNNIGVAVPGTTAPTNQAYAGGSTGGCSGINSINNTWSNNIFFIQGPNTSLNSTVNVWFCCTVDNDVISSPSNKISVDPKFTNAGSHNFKLQSTSPGLNAGTSALSGLGIATPNIGAL